MDFLTQNNRRVTGERPPAAELIDAGGKNVVVIGGGDTGADCIGTANRQGAASVTQIELLPKPPENRPPEQPWPLYPKILKTQSSHDEGVERLWSIGERRFSGNDGKVSGVECVKLRFPEQEAGGLSFEEIPGTEFTIQAELVLLAMGFLGPEREGVIEELGLQLDPRGNVKTDSSYMSSAPRVFAAGDMRRGQSLVVWACREGKEAAYGISRHFSDR
jgi:glutamate synthase (NADPH/NADH) small chain